MTAGPGKYDHACTLARIASGAQVCVVIVIDGDKGTGFSVQATQPVDPRALAGILRETARMIEQEGKS